jgi:hypothetical protein
MISVEAYHAKGETMRISIITALTFFLMGSSLPPTQENVNNQSNGESSMNSDNVVIFDYESLQGSESVTFISDSGKKAIMTLSKDEISSYDKMLNSIENNTYTISYSSLTENISFKVVIVNHIMISVHSGSYTTFGYSVNSTQLRLNHSKSSSYILNCSFLFHSWTNSLNARITTTNTLEIKFNA